MTPTESIFLLNNTSTPTELVFLIFLCDDALNRLQLLLIDLQTLVQVPGLPQLQNLVDRLKNVGELLMLSLTQYGDLHLQVSTSLITVGSEFRKLRVLGIQAATPSGDQNLTAPTRTEMAIQRGEALSVQVSLKHLAKSLQCHLAKPDCAFYGISPQGGCLTVIFQFFIPGTRLTDKSVSFHCRLPVLDTGSN